MQQIIVLVVVCTPIALLIAAGFKNVDATDGKVKTHSSKDHWK